MKIRWISAPHLMYLWTREELERLARWRNPRMEYCVDPKTGKSTVFCTCNHCRNVSQISRHLVDKYPDYDCPVCGLKNESFAVIPDISVYANMSGKTLPTHMVPHFVLN